MSEKTGLPHRDQVIQPESVQPTLTVFAPTVTISTPFWLYWLDIAIEQLDAAVRARSEGKAARAEGGDVGTAIMDETRAAMVATVASAACIESFYKTVAALIECDLKGSGPPAKAAFTVLIRSFAIDESELERGLQQLFDDRNEAIHSRETDDPTARHPLGVSTGRGNAFFTVERAGEAVGLAADVLEECAGAVRPGQEFMHLAQRMEGHTDAVRARAERVRRTAGEADGKGEERREGN